jgi:hypothetical protein
MVYTLFLTTQNGRQPTNTSDSYWDINWDNLFNNENHNYKKCRVRFEINSTTLQSTTTAFDYKARNGYITANFATSNQSTSSNSSIVGGCILGTIAPFPFQSWYTGTSSATTWVSFRNSTLDTKGVSIMTPRGTGTLQISLYCFNSTGPISPSIMDYDNEYTLLLQFDFEEED